jgi:hypothetical protein
VTEAGTPQRLRTGNGANYKSKQFKEYCRDSKIKQESRNALIALWNGFYSFKQNYTKELLGKNYIATAVHIRNLPVSVNSNQKRSPFELFTGKAPRRNHLRVFGCTA